MNMRNPAVLSLKQFLMFRVWSDGTRRWVDGYLSLPHVVYCHRPASAEKLINSIGCCGGLVSMRSDTGKTQLSTGMPT